MKLTDIFAKDIQRPIQGVIMADDAANLGIEVEEYVLTNEAAKGLEMLLEEYTNYQTANGVWISGFFGSGKSHLLKMLAHLLGNVEWQDFDRLQVSESFRAKAEGAFLPGLLTKAERIPARSLLFNIDQKATLIAKDQTDALLKVFVKVFDESRGYYGNQGHVARFERDLDNRGLYEAFKSTYSRIAGRDWLQGREEGVLEELNIARAYAEVSGVGEGAPTNILTKYRNDYAVSIEDFADDVKGWLDQQDPSFRLNFFVDEVGQFIGSNTHLMLNLQTIAESLNTKCRGRAWIFVTSQEDMDQVLGDRTKQQGNDFSKIQARFKTRLHLTSADVEEVIRKRLLEKSTTGETTLRGIYVAESANFKTLFDFVDGAKRYRNYTDEEHFVGTYPFVSYQFPLFQDAIEGLSEHNVFEGRHSSVGERSMLGVVQEVAKSVGESGVGSLATFDAMFEGVRSSLKTAAQKAILVAEQHLEDLLAVRLLKALFLVKYVEGFRSTPRNLTVLVYDRFGMDLPALARQVQEALALLETQTYVQRNGDVYEYLTNEEQEIETEIKNVDVDSPEVSSRLFKILSADVVRSSKFRYAPTSQDFPFGYKLDDQPHGIQKELTLHFITPEYPYELEQVKAHSMGKDELRVLLDLDDRALSDLRLLIKTEKYVKRKQTASLTPTEQRILQARSAYNVEREKELVERVRRATGQSKLIVNATEVNAGSDAAVGRVEEGLHELVRRVYTNLTMLGGVSYSESQVAQYVNPDPSLFGTTVAHQLDVPSDEVLAYVMRQEAAGARVTVKLIVDTFQTKPYGWDLAAIEVVVGWLFGTSKVALSIDGNAAKRTEVAQLLRNTQKHPQLVVARQKTWDERKVKAFRDFCVQFFDEPNPPSGPLELARHGADLLRAKSNELKAMGSVANYPFLVELTLPIELLEGVIGKVDEWYLTDFGPHGDALLDAKDSLLDPIAAFLGGAQRAIYDDAVMLLISHADNLRFVPAGSDAEMRSLLADAAIFRGNKSTQLKTAAARLRDVIDNALAAERFAAKERIARRHAEIEASADFSRATEAARQQVSAQLNLVSWQTDQEESIALLRQAMDDFDAHTYPSLLDELARSVGGNDSGGPEKPVVQTVSVKSIVVSGTGGILETDAEVDAYVQRYSAALKATIADGKRIAL
jgi:hypothetical protein